MFEEFQDDFTVDGHLWYLSGMIKAILGLHFGLKAPISFMFKRKDGLEDVVWRIPRWLFMILFIMSSCCMMPPLKFLLKRIYELEEVVWKIPRKLFSAWPSFVSEWNKRSISELFLAWHIQLSFYSWGHTVWRKMLFKGLSGLLFSSLST